MSTERPDVTDVDRTDSVRVGQDEVLIAALARGLTYRAAAEAAGVSRRTVARRMAEEAFAEEVAKVRGEYVSVVTGRLLEMAPAALDVLLELLHDETVDRRLVVKDILNLGKSFQDFTLLGPAMAQLRRDLDRKQDR